MQEHKTFIKFGDSLLSKASKLADLQADLECFVQEGGKGPEQKRLNSSGAHVARVENHLGSYKSLQVCC